MLSQKAPYPHLVLPDRVGPVVDDEPVVAVYGDLVEPEHEPLQDGLCLEGDHAVHVSLVARDDHGPVDGTGDVGEEAGGARAVTELANRDWKKQNARILVYMGRKGSESNLLEWLPSFKLR